MNNFLVIHTRAYDFEGNDGRQIEGVTVTYIDMNADEEPDEQGLPPLSLSVDKQKARAFSAVPGVYEMDFSQRRGAKGKAVLVFNGARLLQPVQWPANRSKGGDAPVSR